MPVPASTSEGIAVAEVEKASRTLAQQKLDSQIVLALKKSRHEAPFDRPTALQPDLTVQPDGRIAVDLQATVSPDLLEQIRAGGGEVVNSFPGARAIRAIIPLPLAESLAAKPEVSFISPAATGTTNGPQAASGGPPLK